jgi:23S rRNA (cytosine1962-C5)-methyltransferase
VPSRQATRPARARAAKPSSDEPEVTLSRRGLERLRSGHVWVYRSDLRAPAELKGGEVVRLVDDRGWFAGKAFYGKQSQISVRLLTREEEPIDEAFFARRLSQARALREAAAPDPELRRASRIVHGEADLLPGLVVDRYGDCFVVQTLIEATDARRELFADLLQQLWKPRAIVERNDVKVRAHEGLPLRKGLLRGEAPGPVEFLEGEVRLVADLLEGQKTGAFLDQRENYAAAAQYAHGEALDVFCYHGGFALHLAPRCTRVTAIDSSRSALEVADQNAALNQQEVEWIEANAFDLLKDYAVSGQRYDTIVLDPPAFAKSKRDLDAALRGYKELNLRALKMLRPGGILVTCSCSFHVSQALFLEMLAEAARDAHRTLRLVEIRGQSKDHPILLNIPETAYLKCLIFSVIR